MPAPAVVWRPDAELLSHSNVARFMAAEGIADFPELVERSIDEPEWFWDAVVRFLGVRFSKPYERVLDTSDGIPWAKWFTGGKCNIAETCVDQWSGRDDADEPAVIWEGEEGATRELTWPELRSHTDALAQGLAARGVRKGDAVGLFLPMVPETVVALFAVAKLGAVFLPIFSGYGAEAVAVRLEDAGAVALITADGFTRRGKVVAMKEVADEAVARVPSVHTVVVVPRLGREVTMQPGRDVAYGDLTNAADAIAFDAEPVDSEHPLFVAYTSGTTGRPKGAVHVHAGFLVKIAEEVAFQTDLREGERLFWLTDIGWIMGPWEIVGTLANHGTLVMYDGAPDYPDADRLWAFVERHQVNVLGVSPTLIRALMAHGDEPAHAHDLSSLRVLASTGEPWNEDPWRWYFEVVGGGRCPVINISGGTEVGACFLSPHVVAPISACSLGGPSLGMAVDVFDDAGKPLRGAVGELVCTKPWPGMTADCSATRSAISTRTGRAGPTCGGTATSRASPTTASGSCTGVPTTRSSSRASASVRPRSRRSWSRIPGSWNRRRSAFPTISRAKRCGCSRCSHREHRPTTRCAPRSRSASPTRSARRSSPRRCVSRARSRRRAARRCCGARSVRSSPATSSATCPGSRIRRRSKRSRRVPDVTELHGARVFLRPLQADDWDAWREVRVRCRDWLERWEPIAEAGSADPALDYEAFRARCAAWERQRHFDAAYGFGLFLTDGRFAGEVSIGSVQRGPFQMGYVGYWIDEACGGHEFVPEGVVLLIRYAFDTLRLHRLEAAIVPRNAASRRVAEKLGLRDEGTAQRFLQIQGVYEDHIRYAITREEWRDRGHLLVSRFLSPRVDER